MKSIKEQADYLYQGYGTNPNRKALRENFIQGADYVLDILEKELPLEDNRNLNDYAKALVWRLKNCIEQLKENNSI